MEIPGFVRSRGFLCLQRGDAAPFRAAAQMEPKKRRKSVTFSIIASEPA